MPKLTFPITWHVTLSSLADLQQQGTVDLEDSKDLCLFADERPLAGADHRATFSP